MKQRVVITGIGLLTPLGNQPNEFFGNALAGRSRIGRIKKFDTSRFPVQIGGELDLGSERTELLEPKFEQMPAVATWSVLAARKAVADAGIRRASEQLRGADVVFGVSISSIEHLCRQVMAEHSADLSRVSPQTLLSMNPAVAAAHISHDLGVCGEVLNITTACSSSTSAIGLAMRMIQHGESSCVLAGGADEGVSPLFMGAFANAECLSKRNGDPQGASRPFDRLRDGHVQSDAACVLVLEEYQRAKSRSARIYCELKGYGATGDSTFTFSLPKTEDAGSNAISKALSESARHPGEIDYYCALGVAHPWVDVLETNIIKRAFGATARKLSCSSIKSMMGHPMGAGGAIQAATCALAIKNGAIPPTINQEEADPQCDLDYVPNEARQKKVSNALVYTFGNGGSNGALVLSAC